MAPHDLLHSQVFVNRAGLVLLRCPGPCIIDICNLYYSLAARKSAESKVEAIKKQAEQVEVEYDRVSAECQQLQVRPSLLSILSLSGHAFR